MSAADAFRRAAAVGRAVVARLGMRPTTVSIIVDTYSAAIGSYGAALLSSSTTVLSPSPKVVPNGTVGSWFGGGNTVDAGGPMQANVYKIGPITPQYAGGGYTVSQLAPSQTSPSVRVRVLLTGDGSGEFDATGEEFQITELDATNAMHIYMTVQRADQ